MSAIFLSAPLYCSFQAVRHFEAELARVTAAVRRTFKPQDTLIVGFDSHFLGYRHAAYYLPEFLSVEAPAVLRPEGQRIFAVYERKTTLTATIPVGRFRQFAIFPLPGGSDYYRAYMEKQQGLFPPGVLHSQGSDPAFVTGPIASLKISVPGKNAGWRRGHAMTACIRTMTTVFVAVYWRSHVLCGRTANMRGKCAARQLSRANRDWASNCH